MPAHEATFWESLRSDFITAKDEATENAVVDLIESALLKVKDKDEASVLWKTATGILTPLGPLVTAWKGSLRLAQKTIDQQHRDVTRLADHFVSLEELQPQKVKAWTDKLIEEGATAATLERLMNGCRSLWAYLQNSGTLPMDAVDPFVGSFRLAKKTAQRNTVTRLAFTPDELATVYLKAKTSGDVALSQLVALGAFTGARIEELCSLTTTTCADGLFTITDSKTKAGIRQFPIHPALVPMVADMLKASRDGYLIPSTAAGQYGVRSDPLSKRFGRLKESMGFGPGHVFHSIRKTMATQLERAGVPEGIAADILGHEKKSITYGLYATGSALEAMREALCKVSYPAPLDHP